jgi:hypothetical protein
MQSAISWKLAIILDSPIRKPEKQREGSPPRRGGRVYSDLTAALARFRLLPEQDCDNLWIIDHIARGSLKAVDEGYTWLFDPDLWAKLTYQRRDPEAAAANLKCPLAFIRGENSVLMGAETWAYMKATFTRSPFVSIPNTQHHLILDDPAGGDRSAGRLDRGLGAQASLDRLDVLARAEERDTCAFTGLLFQMRTIMAEEYTRGEMDISEHKASFDGFIGVSVYSTLVIVTTLLCVILVFGAHFHWLTAMFVAAIVGGLGGVFTKQGAGYWATLVVLAIIGFITGGLVTLLG